MKLKVDKNDKIFKIAKQYLQDLIMNHDDMLFDELPDDILKLESVWEIINPYHDEKITDFPMILIKCELFYHHQMVADYRLYLNQDEQFLDEFFTILNN